MRFDTCAHGGGAYDPCRIGRRGLLGGFAATAIAAALPIPRAAAQNAKPRRIDVHHHLSPPAYLKELSPKVRIPPVTMNWTPQASIDQMDAGGDRW